MDMPQEESSPLGRRSRRQDRVSGGVTTTVYLKVINSPPPPANYRFNYSEDRFR